MKKLNLLIGILTGLILFSCSSDNVTENASNFNPKLLKQITSSDGYWTKYFYNDQDDLILITNTSNQISLDSTYLEYYDGYLSRVLQRIYVPVTGIVNTETIFNQNNSTTASGTNKIFLDDGTIFQNHLFEYTFSNNLFKTIKFFNLTGTLTRENIYAHDVNGNLTNLNQVWYNSDGTIQTNKQATFTDWDASGLKTKSLFYWDYNIDILSNIYISSSNCLNRIENGQSYNYSFEYDSNGNVIKYNSIDEQKYINLEYYE